MKNVILVSLSLAFVAPASAAERARTDFDQGVDAQTALSEARATPVHMRKLCNVNFHGESIELREGDAFVRAIYGVDENCAVSLKRVEHLKRLPANSPQTPARTAETRSALVRPAGGVGAKSDAYTCHVTVWEQEIAHMKVVQLESLVDWTADSSGILQFTNKAVSTEFFTWWHIVSGPFSRTSWVVQYTQGHALSQASFSCDGGPFCNAGQTFPITLKIDADIFPDGACRGAAGFIGQVVPDGEVEQTVTR